MFEVNLVKVQCVTLSYYNFHNKIHKKMQSNYFQDKCCYNQQESSDVLK